MTANVLLLVFLSLALNVRPSYGSYPATPVRPVVDEYQGVMITDPYRWLEKADSPENIRWTEDQNAHARAYFDKVPNLKAIREKLKEWYNFKSPDYRAVFSRAGKLFVLKNDPPREQPVIIMLDSPENLTGEKIIVDPNKIDPTGKTAIDFFTPSVDGQYVAVSLSLNGSEKGTLHIYDASNGKELKDQIPRVNNPTAAGSVAWNQDSSGFYYTRYPAAGERPEPDLDFYQQIYFHKLGTSPAEDKYSLGQGFPKIAEIQLRSSEDGRAIVAQVANGDGGEFAHFLMRDNRPWVQLTEFKDKVVASGFGIHEDIYLLSRLKAPRGKLLRLFFKDLDKKGRPLTQARTVIKESPEVIESFVATDKKIYTVDLVGGPTQIRMFGSNGEKPQVIPTEPISDTSEIVRTRGDQILFRNQSYVAPFAWYKYDPSQNERIPSKTALVTKTPVDFGDVEVVREFVQSKDGTRVPLNILYKKGLKLNGKNPALLSGYGGYGISLSPYFQAHLHLWLEHGGVYAVANLRGGGEYGENWHRKGNLDKKQNVFDDFAACMQHLVRRKYTNTQQLAIEGGSNGGLLMGAMLTQHPHMFRAVVSHVGLYDMLRAEFSPNGAFNVTEFGSVKDPRQFKALYAYSPYHHVTDGTPYPSVLLLTGAHDGRVEPAQSKKMAARLQAASASQNPVLLRINYGAGHGAGKNLTDKILERADIYAFLFQELDIKAF